MKPPLFDKAINQCRAGEGHANVNPRIVRPFALNMFGNERTIKGGIENKRLTAGWDEDYLEQVLVGQ